MNGENAPDRKVFELTGTDREGFLQGIVTNDVARCREELVYAALLTPQGKYLADFFLSTRGEAILLDVNATIADSLIKRLTMYKLRADVQIAESALHVQRGLGTPPADALSDPRAPEMGWRRYSTDAGSTPNIDWDAQRVAACIPETGIELIPEETFILEAGFDRIDGVDHRKGCYIGQEVTARMRHKTELRKGLTTVTIEGSAPVGTEITTDGKSVGRLFTQSNGRAIAHVRFGRAGTEMQAGDATVRMQTDAQTA